MTDEERQELSELRENLSTAQDEEVEATWAILMLSGYDEVDEMWHYAIAAVEDELRKRGLM